MAEFPIALLMDCVGVISWEHVGLYYRYEAKIDCADKKFYHLYLHQMPESVSLGVFSMQGELCGKIAANKINKGELVFSLTKTNWLPKCWDDAGNCAVVASTEDERETLAMHRYRPLPQDVMPYVCFLRPVCIENLPCLTLTLDKQGRPLVNVVD